jgi:hypothetical protein
LPCLYPVPHAISIQSGSGTLIKQFHNVGTDITPGTV